MVLAPDAVEVAGPCGKGEGCGAWPVVEERLDFDGSAFYGAEVSIDKSVQSPLNVCSRLTETFLAWKD